MLVVFRVLLRALELLALLPFRILHLLLDRVAFNPRLGPLRYVASATIFYVSLALLLVYVLAPIRGVVGHYTLGEKLHYDAERWLATAIYDARGNFVGTFDPRLDSLRDVNYTSEAIDLGDYVANPDHKSIPVREVPEHYWQCLVYHEDRNLGGVLNPFGIDLPGVLKIPLSTVRRSIAAKRLVLGVGGSTLAMQFVRVIYKTPPHASEGALVKLKRKLGEWWLAPVVYRELTAGGNNLALKQWAANHLWLAQRTGGSPLHGIELTSRIVFGKEAADLSIAEQFVLASAVNRPIILLRRQRAAQRRAARPLALPRRGARAHLRREAHSRRSHAEGGGVRPHRHGRGSARPEDQAEAAGGARQVCPEPRPAGAGQSRHPRQRADAGGALRHPRGDEAALRLRLARIRARHHDDVRCGDQPRLRREGTRASRRDRRQARRQDRRPATRSTRPRSPTTGTAPASSSPPPMRNGEIVRYFEQGENAAYFGSPFARETATGYYDAARESRMVASTGKIIAAIAIANTLRDTPQSLYLDAQAPAQGLESCAKGGERHGRRALVAFACSLNDPLMHRTAQVGQARVKKLIDDLGFNMPPVNADGSGTPPSTAVVLGQVAASPRRVHHLAGVVLASLIGRGATPLQAPTLIKRYDFTNIDDPCPGHDRQDHTEQDHPHRRTRARARLAAGAPVLRGRRQADRHAEGPIQLVRQPACGRQVALREDRDAGDRGCRRHGRRMDRRGPAIHQRRGIFLRRRGRHRLGARAVGAQPARRAGCRAAA